VNHAEKYVKPVKQAQKTHQNRTETRQIRKTRTEKRVKTVHYEEQRKRDTIVILRMIARMPRRRVN
jgi:hypothetical protein